MDTSVEACDTFIGTGPVRSKTHLVEAVEEKVATIGQINDDAVRETITPEPGTATNEIIVIDDDSELEFTQ